MVSDAAGAGMALASAPKTGAAKTMPAQTLKK